MYNIYLFIMLLELSVIISMNESSLKKLNVENGQFVSTTYLYVVYQFHATTKAKSWTINRIKR